MNKIFKRNFYNQAGFSLVEIMIGLVIGLLVTLVISQVMSIFEGQKRSTTGTADAQTNGAIALYNIGRELQFAGYPILPTGLAGVADSPLECSVFSYGATGITSIAPVSITEGVATASVSASDSITIRYGDSQSGGIPAIIKANPVGQVVSVDNNFGCNVNDISLVSDGINCDFSTVTAVTGTTTNSMSVTLQNIAGATVGTNISCLGTWSTVIYAVNPTTGNLERSVNGAAAVPVVAGVVNIQAQYGVSNTVNSNQVNQWVNASGAWAAPLSTANRNRIKSVRVAIVARNPKIEPAAVTNLCDQTASPPTGLCSWADLAAGGTITTASPAPTLNLLPGDANWARYHYRVFETVMPLRNIVWSKDTL